MTADLKTYISLHQAAALIPGATPGTLKRMHRAGKLTVYKVGKKYCTTLADLETAIAKSKVVPVHQSDTSSTEQDSAALDAALAGLRKRPKG